ncbi:MAG: 5'-nucleotidase C-terminal domain-containing protein [Eubacteriaceae bacterium]|nr:5'-nucleotidase C-terminal domain-containing protein [Eubacteriaceae bacterium]
MNDSSAPYRSYDIYNQFADKFDFMIDGHSHTVMEEGEKLERIQSTGSSLTDIGVIIIDAATKKIDTNYLYVISDDSPKDDTVAALAKDLMSQIDASYSEVFASTEVFLDGTRGANRTGETGLADLVADAMLWSVVSQSELELPEENYVAVINGGGIRANLPSTSSADNIVADITKKDVNTVLPFGNTVTVTYITGEMLLEALEASTYCSPASIGGFPQVSGMKYVIDINEEYDANEKAYPGSTYYGPKSINRVTITEINGKAFDPDATYAVVTNDFCANGGDTYYAFTIASKQFDTGVPVDEVLISYIGTVLNGVIGEKYGSSEGRITYTEPAPPAAVYEFTEGQGQTVDRSETGEVSFRINGPLESFEKLFIDGEETDPALYSAYEGSTVVVLSKQLVDSLSTGKHTIQAVFRDGTAVAPFYVADTSSSESPYTGLYTHRAEWILCLALASAMALVIAMRRRQMN